jgi:hypothetical protein
MNVKTCATAAAMMAAAVGAGAGCAAGSGGSDRSPRVVTPADATQTASLLDRLKLLEGEWTTTDSETGQTVTASVFKVTAAGSAVSEQMFPGTSHEMTNVYHMDGPSLVVTHYCAAGNQPRMRATAAHGNTIPFRLDSVTNLTAPGEMFMGNMTLEFIDAGTIVEHWETVRDGKVVPEHSPTLVLTRKK